MIISRFRGVKEAQRTTIRLEREMKRKATKLVDTAADILVNDIRSNWSSQSPSSPGYPPAIKTGNLDSSVQKDSQGRDPKGRFATKGNRVLQFVRIDTAKGKDPAGRGSYAAILEDLMNRPFIQPAIDRLQRIYPSLAKRKLR